MGWKKRLRKEYDELGDRVDSLEKFMDSKNFDKLPWEDKAMLMCQRGEMWNYSETLRLRMERIS